MSNKFWIYRQCGQNSSLRFFVTFFVCATSSYLPKDFFLGGGRRKKQSRYTWSRRQHSFLPFFARSKCTIYVHYPNGYSVTSSPILLKQSGFYFLKVCIRRVVEQISLEQPGAIMEKKRVFFFFVLVLIAPAPVTIQRQRRQFSRALFFFLFVWLPDKANVPNDFLGNSWGPYPTGLFKILGPQD